MGQETEMEGIAARRAALALVTAATEEGRLLSELLPKAVARLEPGERARAQRLAAETLRWASRADRVLGPYLRMKPRGRTHNALRMGVWEICADGGPRPHRDGPYRRARTRGATRGNSNRVSTPSECSRRKIAR